MTHARSEYRDFMALTRDAYDAVLALSQIAAKAGMDKQLLELIKLRASQINGCAFCVQFHIMESEKLGVPADKLNLVVVWREAPQFSARERAALAWTEALTLLPSGVSDECASKPRTRQRQPFFTLWATTVSMPVGSPTMQPAGCTPRATMSTFPPAASGLMMRITLAG